MGWKPTVEPKPRKLPIAAATGRAASSTDPATWSTRPEAEARDLSGIGIALGPLDGTNGVLLCGVDLDGAVYTDGTTAPWADAVVERFGGYVERSPSGTGLHVLFLARETDVAALRNEGLLTPKGGASFAIGEHREVALYTGGRYFTVTDDRVSDTDALPFVKPKALRWLLAEHGPSFKASKAASAHKGDDSGSGHGYRFARDCARRCLSENDTRAAFDADGGAAGEWWVRVDDRERDRTIENAFASVQAERAALIAKFDVIRDDPPTSHLTFLNPSQCAAVPLRGYVWKGMIAPGDVGCVFGAPGAGKSLLAPLLAFRVAHGEACFGSRTKAGRVFYIAAEDPTGVRGRFTALRHEVGDVSGALLVEGVSNLLTPEAPDLKALGAAVAKQRPRLVVIDTLAMAFPGLEENSAEAMGRVVAVARTLASRGAAVLLVHHDTKAEGGTPRGHSVLNGALDMALHVAKGDDGIVRGKLTKNRNGPCDRDIAFRIGTVKLGTDEDGDDVTAPYADELRDGAAPAKRTKLSARERAAWAALETLAGGGGSVPLADWREACVREGVLASVENRDSRGKAIRRATEAVIDKGFARIGDGLVTPVRATNAADDDGKDWQFDDLV